MIRILWERARQNRVYRMLRLPDIMGRQWVTMHSRGPVGNDKIPTKSVDAEEIPYTRSTTPYFALKICSNASPAVQDLSVCHSG